MQSEQEVKRRENATASFRFDNIVMVILVSIEFIF